jgi:hypothetical protein
MEFQERHPVPTLSTRVSNAPSQGASQAPSIAPNSTTVSGTQSEASSGHSSSSNLAGLASGTASSVGGERGPYSTGWSSVGIAAMESESSRGSGAAAAPSGQKFAADYGVVPSEPAGKS